MLRMLVRTAVTALTLALGLARAEPVFPEPHPRKLATVRVIGFGGGFNLPIWAGQRQGFFAEEGLDLKLDYTPGSTWQVTHLLAGDYEVAMTAIDNVVAYDEGQGEAYVPKEVPIDLVAVLGSDDAFLSVSAQGAIRSFADLRGKTLTVDAMTTGFAFVLRELLARNGIPESEVSFARAGGVADRFRDMLAHADHAATVQMTPFDLLGEAKGFNTLVRVRQALGAYQGMTAAVRRSWAEKNRDTVVGFVRAYQRAVDWLYDAQNRPVAEALLVAHVPGMSPALAAKTYDILLGPDSGFYRTVRPNIEGIRTVLRLRSKYAEPRKELGDPMKYIDTSYFEAAQQAKRR